MSSFQMVRDGRVPVALPLVLVLLSVVIKLAFVAYLGGHVYADNLKIINYGALVAEGTFSIDSSIVNDKTFIGPLLWWRVYDQAGIGGYLTINFVAFLGLCAVFHALARQRYGEPIRTIALVIFAFYVGTHRNVVAGEPDDNVAALLFALGVLLYVDTRRVLVAALCIGCGFLFKFSTAISGVGFAAYLLWRRSWHELAWALFGMGLPFLLLNVVDGGTSLRALFVSLGIQHGYSSWASIGSKFVSTGLLPMVVIATWAWWRRRDDIGTLFWLLAIAYPVYALVNRDAFAATFVMMVCLLTAAFLLAEALMDGIAILPRAWRLPAVVTTLTLYVVLTTALTHLNLYRDTVPIVMVESAERGRLLFPYNY